MVVRGRLFQKGAQAFRHTEVAVEHGALIKVFDLFFSESIMGTAEHDGVRAQRRKIARTIERGIENVAFDLPCQAFARNGKYLRLGITLPCFMAKGMKARTCASRASGEDEDFPALFRRGKHGGFRADDGKGKLFTELFHTYRRRGVTTDDRGFGRECGKARKSGEHQPLDFFPRKVAVRRVFIVAVIIKSFPRAILGALRHYAQTADPAVKKRHAALLHTIFTPIKRKKNKFSVIFAFFH